MTSPHITTAPLLVCATRGRAISDETRDLAQHLACAHNSQEGDVVGVSRLFKISENQPPERDLFSVSAARYPDSFVGDIFEAPRPYWAIRKAPELIEYEQYGGLPSGRSRKDACEIFVACLTDQTLTGCINAEFSKRHAVDQNPKKLEAITLRDCVIVHDLHFISVGRDGGPEVFLPKIRDRISVTLREDLSQHETLAALANASRFLTDTLQTSLDYGRRLSYPELQISVVL